MKAKRKRWECPDGKHAGVLAPGRMRKNDVRRFCLDCSVKAGFLVERVCPSLDKEREAKTVRRKTKAKKKRASSSKKKTSLREARIARRQEALFLVVSGTEVDLIAEAYRLWRLPSMKEARRDNDTNPKVPHVEIRVGRRGHSYSTGHAWQYGRAHGRVTMTRGTNPLGVLKTLLHELVHCAVGCEHKHDATFRRVLLEAAEEGYGVKADPGHKTYGTDYRLGSAMYDALAAGLLHLGGDPLPACQDVKLWSDALRLKGLAARDSRKGRRRKGPSFASLQARAEALGVHMVKGSSWYWLTWPGQGTVVFKTTAEIDARFTAEEEKST